MNYSAIIYKALPVFWWIAIWELTEFLLHWLVAYKKEWRILFYVSMIIIILGILYWDKEALEHF